MKFNLKNKNIIISGASYGLGSLIAKEFSKEGCNLALLSRSKNKLEKVIMKCKNSNKHKYYCVDFQNINTIEKIVLNVIKDFKKIDIIMHVAGGGLGIANYIPKREDYMKVFNLNLFSVFEINKILIPHMKKNNSGTIFHVGSIASNEAVWNNISYNVAKETLSYYVMSLSKN